MTPVVQYVRASTGLQTCSLEQQAAANAAYAAVRGLDIIDTYSDEAISGLTLKARKGLQQLLADALAPGRRFQAILVYDVSRWGRFQDIDEGAHYEFLCRRAGVALHYCAEPFTNDGSPESELLKQVKRAIAAEESRARSARIRFAKRQVIAAGFVASAPPFALQRQVVDLRRRPIAILQRGQMKATSAYRTIFTPGPPEAVAVVRAIFRLYAVTGLRLSAIAAQLNADGAPSPDGQGWSGTSVRRALRQEAYAGVYVYGRRRSRLGEILPPDPAETQRVEGAIPAIVPRPLFDRANALLDAHRQRNEDELLQDLRVLFADAGRLTASAIDFAPDMANSDTYRRRFGTLGEAYRRIGYAPRRAP